MTKIYKSYHNKCKTKLVNCKHKKSLKKNAFLNKFSQSVSRKNSHTILGYIHSLFYAKKPKKRYMDIFL